MPYTNPIIPNPPAPLVVLQTMLERSFIKEENASKMIELSQQTNMANAFSEIFIYRDGDCRRGFIVKLGLSLLKRLPNHFNTNGHPVWEFPDKSSFVWSGSHISWRDLTFPNVVYC